MDYQSYLSQKYQGHESFLENIIFPIFGEGNYENAWDVELLDSEELRGQASRTGIRSIIRCGTINLDLTPIEVFDITVSDRLMMEKNRVGVQAVIRRVMDTYSGSFMLIHYDNDTKWDWRFTFCQLKDKDEFTDSKRYTFLLGPNQSCRTAAQNFQKLADLNQVITIKDIQSAFDVEALSKEFFGKYKNHYERFVEYITGKRYVKENGKFVEKTSHEPHPVYYAAFGNNDKAVRDYVKLTLGRIILMHFVQKKGWLGVPVGEKWGKGDEQFMRNLFIKATEEQKEDFLETVLEPLFFEAIDTDRRDSGDVFDTKVLGKVRIPYLNGGLFEKNKEDNVVVKFPANYFDDLLEFFSEYNFTIDENDPNEAQVGIDPEMLSQIFENLLEDNKDKGAFYTPKEIVKYMCQESLIAYLVTKTNYEEEKIRRFVHNPDIVVYEFSEKEKEELLDAILSVKICDPAIGSGAFPIGLLNELVRCKEAIFGDKKGRADIKREIIRDNIYGVDIEKGAVDIARLRFWLSLVVDEEEPTPLPNLDFKIMQGNSLSEKYNGVDLSHLLDDEEGTITWGEDLALRERLSTLLKKYFDCDNHIEKTGLKGDISDVIKEKLNEFSHRGRYGDEVLTMTNINISENNQFFLWHTWFADVFKSGGFDIMIGNPPYIQLQNDGGKLGELYKNGGFETFTKTGDIYCLFYEQGINFLKLHGSLCYITSNKWMRAGYGEKTRAYISSKTNPELLIDFAGLKIFESATVDTNILLLKKDTNKKQTKCVIATKDSKECLSNLSDYVQHNMAISEFISSDSWVILSNIEQSIKNKIEKVGIPLSQWDITINYGIKTGYNEAFIITTDKRNELLASCKSLEEKEKTDEIIRPILRGRDIKRNTLDWDNLWIINIHNGIKGRVKRIDINDYPTIKRHLDQYWDKIEHRTDKGDTPYNLRNCAYLEDFDKPKIIYPETTQGAYFVYDDNGYIIDKTCFMMLSKDAKFLQQILSSCMFEFAYKKLYSSVELGASGYQYNKHAFLKLPIILPEEFNYHGENITDEDVFKAYNLTEEEITWIKDSL